MSDLAKLTFADAPAPASPVVEETETVEDPTVPPAAPVPPPAKRPLVGPKVITGYYYLIGILGLSALVGFGLADPQSVMDMVKPANFLVLLCMAVCSSLCNFLSFKVPPGLFFSLSMGVYQVSFLIFSPVPASIAPIVGTMVFEIFVVKRGLAFAVRSCGILILTTCAACVVYQATGPRPYLDDFSFEIILPALLAFIVFRIINEFFIITNLLLEGASFKQSFYHVQIVTLIYLGFLPAALLVPVYYFRGQYIAFAVICAIVILVNYVISRSYQAREKESLQLNRVRELNEELARQNERQRFLGSRINQSLSSFLPLVQYYTQSSFDQESAVTQIATTIEELSRTASQIAGSANNVATAAEQAREAADTGQQAVTATIDAIGDVRLKMQEIAAKISELEDKSERIGEIVTVINAIAGEIRLLALNATIEASGAGQFGRRFLVVANEVNQLADRSREALKQIREIIVEIQSATVSSRKATVEGLSRMERSVELASLSERANQEIISVVEHTAQAAAAISLATQQQRSASEQVVTSVRHVASRISRNADRISTVSVASSDLEGVAAELQVEPPNPDSND